MPSSAGECPSSDLLALFIDGVCTAKERRSVISHLDRCSDCSSVVVEAVHFNRRHRSPSARPAAQLRRLAILTTAGAVAAALVLLVWKLPATPSPETVSLPSVVAAMGRARLADLPQGWSVKEWTVARGAQSALSTAEVAFRLGARTVDLHVALSKNEIHLAESMTYELTGLLGTIPMSEPFVVSYETLRELSSVEAKTEDALMLSARTAELLGRHLEEPFFEFGFWTESSLVAAQAGATDFFVSSFAEVPEVEDGTRSEAVSEHVVRIVALLDDELRPSDLRNIEASLRDIVSANGGPILPAR